jgi:hypothetical protein
MGIWLVVLAAGWFMPARAADEPAANGATGTERIAALITQLGNDEFTLREKAAEELTGIGVPAFAALEAAGKHPDREIRFRSQRILGRIRQLDMQRRLEAFLAGKDEEEGYQLPGWERFRKSFGDQAASRTLFVEMQKADAELLKALEEGPLQAAEVLGLRTAQLQEALRFGQQQQASLGQVAATLFVAAEEDVTPSVQTMSLVLNQCFQPGFRDILTNSQHRDMPRKMLGSIIRRSDGQVAYAAINVANQLNLPEGIEPAVKVLNNPPQPHMVPQALMLVTKSGDPAHLPAIEKLLENKTVITRATEGNNKVTYELQVRDTALASAILLSKQELRNYFDPQVQQITDIQQIIYNARLIGFPDEETRTKAFDKWAKYKASLPKAEPEPPVEAKPQP